MRWKRAVFYGGLLWLIPFVVSVIIYPLKESTPALFESIMPVVITVCTVVFVILYFEKDQLLKEGVSLGVFWLIISIVLDLLLFMEGPMKMPFTDYMADIGLTYLIIPVITSGYYYVREK